MERVHLSVRAEADGSVVGELYRRQRERVWGTLGDEIEGMVNRVAEGLLPAVDEWQSWFSVRRCMDALDGADAASALAELDGPLTKVAAGLYNQYGERALARAVFRRLAEHAERFGFSELHRVNANNCQIAA